MKKILTLMFMLALTQLASAVPAKRVLKKVRQSDGTTMMVMLHGDEHVHYYATMDGVPVMRTSNGDYTYARLSNGQLSASDVLAHAAPIRPIAEQEFALAAPALRKQLSENRNVRLQPINATRAAVAEKRRQARRAPMLAAAQENEKGLIILVNFQDKKLQETSTVETFDRFANTVGLTGDVNYGSIHDYFKAQSYGKFNVMFDIAGPVTVSKDMSYYGANDSQGNDKHPEEMVYEAVKLVNSQVNFADYDWDGDGVVENIYVVYAGYGEASGADENTIWPHQYQLLGSYTYSQLKFDGVYLNTYACGSELMGDGYEYDRDWNIIGEAESGELDGIGTMCHEFSHCLGLPDFYDTNYLYFGMDMWSVMDGGCNNNDGFSPANYTAYERWFSGWMEPVELNTPTIVKDMPALANEPVAYVIYNDKNRNEYFLLENRQPIGFDWGTNVKSPAIMTHGLMITHVTYDENAWYRNEVNTDKMQRMTIVPADNVLYGANDLTSDITKAEQQYYKDHNYNKYAEAYYAAYNKYIQGLCSDLWPNASYDGKTIKRDFTDSSKPAATLNTANSDGQKLLHKPVTDITETASGAKVNGQDIYNISFKFMGGKTVFAPSNLMATAITTNGFTASWTPSADAVSYQVELLAKKDDNSMMENLLLSEDFVTFSTDGNDGTQDLSAILDDFTCEPGWTGEKIYKAGKGCKVGNAKGGYLQSPLLTSSAGTITIYMLAAPYGNDAPDMTVSAISANGSTLDTKTLDMNENEYELLMQLQVTEPCYIKIKPAKRAYVYYFLAFDGAYTWQDMENLETVNVKRMDTTAQSFTTQDTKYVFTDLDAESKYSFRVKAVDAEGYESAWTDWVSVKLAADGVTGLSMTPPAGAAWYDLQGRHVLKPSSTGTYIIHQGSSVRKVIIK